jgi:hypothetical protein
VNVKMLLRPVPQKFNTFNTFAKFAKFANFNPAPEHPTLLHHHAPRPGSISARRLDATSPLSCLRRERGLGGEGILIK